MDAACAVGRLGVDGRWIGFAPTLDDGYALVVGDDRSVWRGPAVADDLLCLAILYFEDALGEPPEQLAATHADIGALVRHVAEMNVDPTRQPLLSEAVDAVDDGLAADAVTACLYRCLRGVPDPRTHLDARVAQLAAAPSETAAGPG